MRIGTSRGEVAGCGAGSRKVGRCGEPQPASSRTATTSRKACTLRTMLTIFPRSAEIKSGELSIGGQSARALAEEHGTPLVVQGAGRLSADRELSGLDLGA